MNFFKKIFLFFPRFRFQQQKKKNNNNNTEIY